MGWVLVGISSDSAIQSSTCWCPAVLGAGIARRLATWAGQEGGEDTRQESEERKKGGLGR
jgi:hypothetical protein